MHNRFKRALSPFKSKNDRTHVKNVLNVLTRF
nr:MAG TPA: hypothetical protein [Caudoviricetes sp.]